MTSETDKELLLRVAVSIDADISDRLDNNFGNAEELVGRLFLCYISLSEARTISRVLREAAEGGWRPISEATGSGPILGFQGTPGDFENQMATCRSYPAGDALIWIGAGGLMPTHFICHPSPPVVEQTSFPPAPQLPPLPSPEPATHSLEGDR